MLGPTVCNRRSAQPRRRFNRQPGQERRRCERRSLHSGRYLVIIAGIGFDELDLALLLPIMGLIIYAIFGPVGSVEPYFR